MASCRDCPCDSASCRDSRQEAKSHGQSLQEAIYQAHKSLQEERDHGQSQWKPNMTDSLCREHKLADSLIPCVQEQINQNPKDIIQVSHDRQQWCQMQMEPAKFQTSLHSCAIQAETLLLFIQIKYGSARIYWWKIKPCPVFWVQRLAMHQVACYCILLFILVLQIRMHTCQLSGISKSEIACKTPIYRIFPRLSPWKKFFGNKLSEPFFF